MSPVIKSIDAPREITSVAFNFEDMATHAKSYVDKVRAEAERIVSQAKTKAEAIRAQAEQDGLADAGKQVEAMADAKVGEQLHTLLPALHLAIEAVQQARHHCLAQWEQNAVHVAAAIAEKIIRRQLTEQPDITLQWVREALELAAGSPELRVLLNPQDHQALRSQVEKLAGEIGNLGAAEIVSDPDITPGGCRVETRFGAIDQQIEAQLKRIEQELA